MRPEGGKLEVGPCNSAEKVIRSDPRSGSGDAEESSLTGKASGLAEPFKWRRAEAERLSTATSWFKHLSGRSTSH